MKKLLLAIALMYPALGYSEDKFLYYQFNDNVVITISNVECPLKTLNKTYPNAVVATRKDGQHLFGCFTHKGDTIVIQWARGDKTELPANVFLQENKPQTVEPTL